MKTQQSISVDRPMHLKKHFSRGNECMKKSYTAHRLSFYHGLSDRVRLCQSFIRIIYVTTKPKKNKKQKQKHNETLKEDWGHIESADTQNKTLILLFYYVLWLLPNH